MHEEVQKQGVYSRYTKLTFAEAIYQKSTYTLWLGDLCVLCALTTVA